MNSSSKINLVLVGGGQTHAPVLKNLGMQSPANLDITLISENSIVPYSGMLPGYIAGTYTKEDCLIDLRHLANFSGSIFIQAKVIGLDLKQKLVVLENRPPLPYDIISLNVGSIPNLESITGKENISPIKPAITFFYKWLDVLSKIEKGIYGNKFRVGIIGAGAGGIETALTIQKRLFNIIPKLEIYIFQRGDKILSGLNEKTQNKVIKILREKKINLFLEEEITSVIASSNQYDCNTISGKNYTLDYLVGTVKAKSLDWIECSDLAKDENGFVLVNEFLQSISHPEVFAVGDIASMQNYPRPKAGVFAVRQSLPLYKNIVNLANGNPLIKFKPQEKFLTLLNIGNGKAIATRGKISLGASKWIWNWKHRIDSKFMQKFQNLPAKMKIFVKEEKFDDFQCRGCGGKADFITLQKALDRLQSYSPKSSEIQSKHSLANTLIGLGQREDSAVIQIEKKLQLIQSVDYFKPIVDDLFLSGKIGANHCLNDLYAKGVNAHSAQAIINLNQNSNENSEDLFQILAGANSVFEKEGVELLGGHTNSGTEFGFGFVVNGFSDSDKFYSKKNAKYGESIILTKAIGVGLTFAAEMRNRVSPLTVDAAIQSMLQSNFSAMNLMRKYQIGACTDVTGFGLVGHLVEVLKASEVYARIFIDSIPKLFELEKILKEEKGIQSSLFPSNWKSFEKYITGEKTNIFYNTLFDPQTSGGLLFTLSASEANACVLELQKKGYEAAMIGNITNNKLPDNALVECY